MSRGSSIELDQGRTPWPSDDGEGPVPHKSGVLDPGEVLGRYVVLYRLGTGGMGVVYAAYDPELDRKVALKLLRRGSSDPVRRRRARERLLREARAMARLTHPNVITVHDVAVFGGRVFMAMEYVDGVTLARALAGDGLPWREALDVMIAAGRGLVAAHDAGLVHRDFKPDNVMLGKATQGQASRVLVMDFGLARALEPDPIDGSLGGRMTGDGETPAPKSASKPSIVASKDPGSNLAGTPAYMAPEQRAGQPADARVDQFSFCVSLYEAIYRQRPFRGADSDEIAKRIEAGEIEDPPPHTKVPGWLRAVVMRGLSRDPTARYATMQELLAALERRPVARRRRWLYGAAIGAVIGGAGAGVVLGVGDMPDPCSGGLERLAGVWDGDRRTKVERSFLAVQRPYADDAWARVSTELDRYADEWVKMNREACEANRVRGEQSDDLFDLRMECLGRRRTELAALTDLFVDADAALVEKGVDATGRLTAIAVCADTELLRTPVPLPDDAALRERIEAAREKLAQAKAYQDAGRYDRGLAIVTSVVAETRDIGHAPLLAEALYQEGRLQYLTGDSNASDRTLREAVLVAARGKHDEMAARAWTALAMSVSQGLGRLEPAMELAEMAAAAVERAGGSAELRAELATARGAARAALRRYEAAQSDFEEALEYQRAAFGEAHPSLARFYNNLAVAHGGRGNLDESQRFLERALEIQERNLGPEHPNVAVFLTNLAMIRAERGEEEQAVPMLRRAVDIWRKSVSGDHPGLAQSLNNFGLVQLRRQELDEAESLLRESIGMDERVHRTHPDLARAIANLGACLVERGRHEEGLQHLDRAIAMIEEIRGPGHPEGAAALADVGRAKMGLGDTAGAITALEAAWAQRDAIEELGARSEIPRLAFSLAQALAERDGTRATALAHDAIAHLDKLPKSGSALRLREQVETWLAAHSSAPVPARRVRAEPAAIGP